MDTPNRRECLEVRRLFRLPYRGLVPVTPPTVGLKAGLEVAAPPAVMSLVTPTPACTGEIDRERRPRCSIVDREAGAAWRRDPCRSPSLSSSSRSGVPPAAVHHDGLMAAGRILADGIGMSPGARERVRRFGPAPRSVRSSARCSPARRLIPSCAIASLVALVVGLVDRLGTSRLRACWGDRHRGADRKRLDWVALIRPMVM